MKNRALAFLAAVLCPLAAAAAPLDFFQLDGGRETATAVLVKALRFSADNPAPPLISAVYSYFSSGDTAAIAYTHRWSVVQGPYGVIVGVGAAANSFRNRDNPSEDETGLSLRGQAETYGAALGGSYYGLLQASTFRKAWLGLIQYAPDNFPVGIEMYRQYQEGYQATTTALRISTGIDRWFARVGVVRTSGEFRPFIGVTFNGF